MSNAEQLLRGVQIGLVTADPQFRGAMIAFSHDHNFSITHVRLPEVLKDHDGVLVGLGKNHEQAASALTLATQLRSYNPNIPFRAINEAPISMWEQSVLGASGIDATEMSEILKTSMMFGIGKNILAHPELIFGGQRVAA